MEILTLGLAIGWCVLLGFILSQLKRFKWENALLPPKQESVPLFHHHAAKGLLLPEIVPIPEKLQHQAAMVLVASPTCPPCHKVLEEWVQEHHAVPFICIVKADRKEAYQRLMKKYHAFVPMIPAKGDALKKLHITSFPTFFKVDENGKIEEVLHQSQVQETIPKLQKTFG